jgi:hypothetical protein
MTNEWLQGYLAALKNIQDAIQKLYNESPDYTGDSRNGYFNTIEYIKEVRTNYKKLVEELNAKSENKKT